MARKKLGIEQNEVDDEVVEFQEETVKNEDNQVL